MENRQDLGAVQRCVEAMFIPVSVGIINGYEGRCFGGRGVGESILGITTIDLVTLQCSQGKEEALDGLLNTRGVGGGNAV